MFYNKNIYFIIKLFLYISIHFKKFKLKNTFMNNPEAVRLEAFTITLKPETGYGNNRFDDLISNITGVDIEQDLFSEFYKLFINHIDLGYTEIRSKAFTLTTDRNEYGIDIPNHTFWGVLKGGPKGNGKTKSPIVNREHEEDLSDDVINDKFFFYFHFPLDGNYGYLFFQIYGGESIRKEFIQHITDLFKIRGLYKKAECTPILPNSIRDEFKNNSKIVEMSYITRTLSSSLTENTEFANLCSDYKIEISIKPIGDNAISPERIPLMNRVLNGLCFHNIPLSTSTKKKVSLQNLASKKTSKFELDTSDVMPRIYLNGKVPLDAYGTPNFANLKTFCDGILRELITGEYTRIARL